MADARAEQILAALETVCTGLTTTGANVERDRVYFIDEDTTSSLSIVQGSDTPISEEGEPLFDVIDWELEVIVRIVVKRTSGLGTAINQIRKEVHAAIMADDTLGLSFVHSVVPSAANETELSEELEQKLAGQDVAFLVQYRTSRTDLDA